jgi:hypothetical protein
MAAKSRINFVSDYWIHLIQEDIVDCPMVIDLNKTEYDQRTFSSMTTSTNQKHDCRATRYAVNVCNLSRCLYHVYRSPMNIE